MRTLYLDWHLGLGDAIICNGLVRWLARENPGRHIVIPCYQNHNTSAVSQMFADLTHWRGDVGPSVFVVPDTNPPPHGCLLLPIGMNNPGWGTVTPFDRAFYAFAGVPFDAKWDLFHIPESNTELPPPDYRYALLHEDRARGFAIDRSRIKDILIHSVTPGKTPRISDWRHWIANAAEVHVIDSSVMHLAELLPTNGKLFYHKYARPNAADDAIFRKAWTVYE